MLGGRLVGSRGLAVAGFCLMVAAGAAAALANFVPWYVGAVFGVASGGASLWGGVLWQRRVGEAAREEAFRAVTTQGPYARMWGADGVDEGLLSMLLPERRLVPFSPLHEPLVRQTMQWATGLGQVRESVLYLHGAPGSGKTRLMIEVTDRLEMSCGWAMPGCGPAAVSAAVALLRPVMLVFDDAETRDDIVATLTRLGELGGVDVRLVLVTRLNAVWWSSLRDRLPGHVLARLPYRAQLSVPEIVGGGKEQQQMFARALRCFRGEPPPVFQPTLRVQEPPPSIALLQAAALWAAHTGADETVEITAAASDVFGLERRRWRASAACAGLADLPEEVLEHAVLLAALAGAADAQSARRLLASLFAKSEESTSLGMHELAQVADWIRGLYPSQTPDWLAPRLPAVLLEGYAAQVIVRSPALGQALADGTAEDDLCAQRVLSILARASAHSPHALSALIDVIERDRFRMIGAAINVALSTGISLDSVITTCVTSGGGQFTGAQLGDLFKAIPEQAQAHMLAGTAVALLQSFLGLPTADQEHLDVLTVQHYLAHILANQGRYQEAVTHYREVITAQTRLLGPENPATLSTRNNLATALDNLGCYELAEVEIREVLNIRMQVLEADHPDILAARYNAANALVSLGRYEQAETEYREVLTTQIRLFGAEHPQTLSARYGFALALNNQGLYEQAETEYRETLAIQTRLLGLEHPETLTIRSSLALVLYEQGLYEQAETEYRETLAARTRLLGPEHPDTLKIRRDLALVLADQGRYKQAETECREVVAAQIRLLGAEHPDTLSTRHNHANMLANLGRHEQAETEYRETLATQTRLLGAEHPDTLSTRHDLANLLLDRQRFEQAETEIREVIPARTRLLGPEHPDTLTARQTLALTLAMQGRYDQAETGFREVLVLQTRLLGAGHAHTANTRHNFATMLHTQGRHKQADDVTAGLNPSVPHAR